MKRPTLYPLPWSVISVFLLNGAVPSPILKNIEMSLALYKLTVTRLEIAFSVNKVSQFMNSPLDTHFKAVKRILRYLKGTVHHGLTLRQFFSSRLIGFSDADCGSDPDDRRSMTGFCVFLGCNIIACSSKKQHIVSRSSTEADYRSLANTTGEIIWIESLLQELKVSLFRKPIVWCDNLSTIALSLIPYSSQDENILNWIYIFLQKEFWVKDLQLILVLLMNRWPTSLQTSVLKSVQQATIETYL